MFSIQYQHVIIRKLFLKMSRSQKNIKLLQKKKMTFIYLKISDYKCKASMSLLLYMNM